MVHNLDIRQHEIFFHRWNLMILSAPVTSSSHLIENKEKNIKSNHIQMTGLSKAFFDHPWLSTLKVCLYGFNGLLF